jgi:tRNA1Val (adenine37-N6)-methyltransferase
MSPLAQRLWGRELTRDAFFDGRIQVFQPRRGWRFSVDAPVLADFVGPQPEFVSGLEVGAGCGIISLLLLFKGHLARTAGLEIQPFYARLCEINARVNRLKDRFTVLCQDFLAGKDEPLAARLIYANPPYYRPGSGHLSPNEEIRMAKWELSLTMESLLVESRRRLAADGRLALILPGFREAELRLEFAHQGFFVERYRPVKPFVNSQTERFLVQLSPVRVAEQVLPPLVLFAGRGQYSAEMSSILRG